MVKTWELEARLGFCWICPRYLIWRPDTDRVTFSELNKWIENVSCLRVFSPALKGGEGLCSCIASTALRDAGGLVVLRLTAAGKGGERQNNWKGQIVAGLQIQHACKKYTESSLYKIQVHMGQYMTAHPITMVIGELHVSFSELSPDRHCIFCNSKTYYRNAVKMWLCYSD